MLRHTQPLGNDVQVSAQPTGTQQPLSRTPPGRLEPSQQQPGQQQQQGFFGQRGASPAQGQQPYYTPPPPGANAPYGYAQPQPGGPPPPPPPQQERKLGSYANALIAAAFIAGLGIGVYFDSEVTLSPNNVSSTEIIDRSTPNADVCMAYGYSASVFDMKLYVTFNP